jgi:hypothetical protein
MPQQLIDKPRHADGWHPSFRERALMILWPAFVMAGVLETLVFVVVDPGSLEWFGAEPLHWATNAVYSVTFFIFWAIIATSAAITQLLQLESPTLQQAGPAS